MRTARALFVLLITSALLPGMKAQSFSTGRSRLIVVGFLGGKVHADNMVHGEARFADQLHQRYPASLHVAVFANHDWRNAMRMVLDQLDSNGDGRLSAAEKSNARIVIYGHSWGASEAVTLARRLNKLRIPVLLTIQVDSVEKSSEDDRDIPPNVRAAVNFYQPDGLVHGRSAIAAMDPSRTTILGNFESDYREHPVACDSYPWFARVFMRQHIEIENDPSIWNRVEALILAQMP